MVSNVLGLLIGAGIDRDEGVKGFMGALGGYLIEGAVITIAPLDVTFTTITGDIMLGQRTS